MPPMRADDHATERFTDRAGDYAAARPGYPAAIATLLAAEFGLAPGAVVADLGSGTGLSCEPFLRAGLAVVGVEPNDAMRAQGERQLAGFATFRSVAGRAEATTLPAASVDLLVAAQAFHWFDLGAARIEALRILKRPAHAALIWNDRVATGSAFAEGYERLLLDFGIGYAQIRHRHAHEDSVAAFFGHRDFRVAAFPNPTELDHETLLARLNSASYVPAPGHPDHAAMVTRLRPLFDTAQQGGRVTMDYVARVFFGALAD
ncbi:MAG: class I SAM-dependent methyltransferase [Burkholderiaceae bacterium]|nr:class I SAM-dependent methyltransferase [Burkholderiaceae bacterium]